MNNNKNHQTPFVTRTADDLKKVTYHALVSIEPGEYAAQKFPQLTGATLFTYCFRRFGYPTLGWDGYKDLTNYLVTTPDPDVFLLIHPYCDGSGYDSQLSFSHLAHQKFRQQERILLQQGGYDAWEASPEFLTCKQALETAIDDLARPTNIRDVYINCCGPVEHLEGLPDPVEYAAGAGYAIVGSCYATAERALSWTNALHDLGGGSYRAGVDRVLALAEEARQHHTQEATDAVS